MSSTWWVIDARYLNTSYLPFIELLLSLVTVYDQEMFIVCSKADSIALLLLVIKTTCEELGVLRQLVLQWMDGQVVFSPSLNIETRDGPGHPLGCDTFLLVSIRFVLI